MYIYTDVYIYIHTYIYIYTYQEECQDVPASSLQYINTRNMSYVY